MVFISYIFFLNIILYFVLLCYTAVVVAVVIIVLAYYTHGLYSIPTVAKKVISGFYTLNFPLTR